jgi:hypothetical protein
MLLNFFLLKVCLKPIVKKILAAFLAIGFLIYLGFAMFLNNPFKIPANVTDSTDFYDNHIFSNNRGYFLFTNYNGLVN